jgi:hypothetical protein
VILPESPLFISNFPISRLLATTRINFRLKSRVKFATFVTDPFFTYVKDYYGDSIVYSCKVLDLNTIPQAKIGSVVNVLVYYSHNELSLRQIDAWLKVYGDLKSKSR